MLAIGAMHLADDSAGDDIARGKLLCFVVTLHEALEIDVAENRSLTAERLGK
jgi:hypothetical protein